VLESHFDSLAVSVGTFVFAAIAIGVAGVFMSITADRLADRTGWGEAIVGAVFLAGATSLPDFAASMTAAAGGYAKLAVSNMMGSLALNIVFLGVGDVVYRKANLEHAAASSANLTQSALLIALISVSLLAMLGPDVALWSIHPASVATPVAYIFGLRLIRHTHVAPMWTPKRTAQTVIDRPDKSKGGRHNLMRLWLIFAALTLVLAAAGAVLMNAAEAIVVRTGLSETTVGTLFTALSTSSPELVTTIAAIRTGALTLAVGSIIGTNCFNVMAIAAADFAYRQGSIYHAVGAQQVFWGLLTILMTAVLLLGFVRRERFGIARIGFESFTILLLYAGAVPLLVFGK
jgi:cation:H+ antiporter